MAKPKPKRQTGPEHEKFWTLKYGRNFGPLRDVNGNPVAPKPEYMIEMECFLSCMGWNKYEAPKESPGEYVECPRGRVHTGAIHHFVKLSDCFFSDPQGIFFFQWNPFAEVMLRDKILNPRYAVAGPASSGKTEFGVVWGILNYFMKPFETKVLVASTTKAAATGKVWGSFVEAWQQIQRCMGGEQNMPGKLLKSQYKIVYQTGGVYSTKAGIELVAGADSQEADSADKIQGYKRGRVFVVADEFATMSKGLWQTIKGNLFANPVMDFIGMFNPDSFYDVAGIFSKPADPRGWDSVTVESESWVSIEGFVRHLDGEKSPNVLAGYEKWRGLLTFEKMEARAHEYGGKTTKSYYQFVRGWWSPTGILDCIYSESEIEKYWGCHEELGWDSPPTQVCGFDPSYTHGGDLAIAVLAECGWVTNRMNNTRKKVFHVRGVHILAEDVKNNDPKVEQMVRQLIQLCRSNQVDPKHMAMDATSGGTAVAEFIARDWSNDFLRVHFGAKASETPVSSSNPTKACDEYANRVTELWYSGKSLLRSGQIRGLTPDLVLEMCARTYHQNGKKLMVESKEDMKLRIGGKSPDKADALFLALDVCRQRLGLSSTERPSKVIRNQIRMSPVHSYLSGQSQKQQPAFDWGPSLKF